MPKDVGGDAGPVVAASASASVADDNGDGDGYGDGAMVSPAASTSKTPTFSLPRPLSEVSFDDAKPSAPAPAFPSQRALDPPVSAPEPPAPTFSAPRPLSEMSFDDAKPEVPRPAPPQMTEAQSIAPPTPAPQIANASGMGISFTGAAAPQAAPQPTPAQLAATNQSLRIRLLRPDGKPFDGPAITTGPKPDASREAAPAGYGTGASAGGSKKQAPKVVVKAGPLERAGHVLAVLLISAIGIAPLGYLLMQSVHDREDKLAATITVPTKMNVLDATADAYLGGMVAVLLVVTVFYAMRLKRRRAR